MKKLSWLLQAILSFFVKSQCSVGVNNGKMFLRQYLIWVMVLLGQLHGYKSCIQKERSALLELKKYIISISEEGRSDDTYPTWTNDTKSHCCQWEGVKCNRTSRRVVEISTGGILYLREGSLLNLSLLHPFKEVRILDLSNSGFNGLFDHVEGYNSLRRLTNLEILDFTSNKFDNSIFPFLNAATSLTTLFLGDNNMDGPFPAKELKNLTNLEVLDLTWNGFNDSVPVEELYALRNLKVLGLSANEFPGSTVQGIICKLKNLQELDISQSNLVGQFPLCITGLSGLRVLDLSSNQMTGELPSALGNLKSLEYISLLDNNFEGYISLGWLANLSELKVFHLDSKSNSLQVVYESSWKPKFQLSVITLRSCKLEKVPHFLLYQKDLRHVDFSHNNIFENFPAWMLANNTKLEVLFLQNNSFTSFKLPESARNLRYLDVSMNEFNHLFPENIGWILPHLLSLNISNNGFQGNLPSSLGNMKSISFMDLSHNSFRGQLPRSFVMGCYSIRILKLSHNKLSGEVFTESANFTDITALTMDNNQFAGKIGQGLRSLKDLLLLDISNNNLTGVIPNWFDEFSQLSAILLSNNSLKGEIPISLFRKSTLYLLDLSANILSGHVPPHVNSTGGLMLLLQNNNLSGVVPDTLLTNVTILDLRNNRLSGNIPEFTNTQSIRILLLRGNNFTGRIPHRFCGLSNIHLLDLADNGLNGSIPSCLSNTSFGLRKVDAFYGYDFSSGYSPTLGFSRSNLPHTDDIGIYFTSLLVVEEFVMGHTADAQIKIEFATKYRYDAYMGGNLLDFFGLDLSQNELSGEIPVELGGLLKLYALNLSHNYLSGAIPGSFSGMKNMESLDLSFNRLQGQIPPQLTELSSLAVFNVSYNNLSGVIPQGRQFNTFDTRSYLSNPLLCGQPTNISCSGNNSQGPDYDEVEADESTIDMVSFYWSFTAAYVTLLVGILASLSFDSSWSRAWFLIVDAFIHKVRNFLR